MTHASRRLAITAYHEAGHAIAVQLRGGTVDSITLKPGEVRYALPHERVRLFRNGVRTDEPIPNPVTHAHGFVAYAGSWACVRARSDGPIGDLARVSAELLRQVPDLETYNRASVPVGSDAQWNLELENAWGDIKALAQRLYDAQVRKVGGSSQV